jgi:hypothetical protein
MDYTQTNPDHDQVGIVGTGDGLDMDMVHDFGEGVGLDMRDFPVHDVEDGLEDSKHLGEYMNEVHAGGVFGYTNGGHAVGVCGLTLTEFLLLREWNWGYEEFIPMGDRETREDHPHQSLVDSSTLSLSLSTLPVQEF